MIKILIADDHKMFLDGLRSFLQNHKHIEIAGEALDGNQVLEILKETSVDVAVLDVEMPGMDGIETTRWIRKNLPETKVLILTMYKDKSFILRLMEAGASGYILKNKSKEELIDAIEAVYNGEAHFGPEVLNTIANAPRKNKLLAELTRREEEILCLIAEGYTSKEIAQKIYISVATVNTHRRNLFQKIDANNDNQLVRFAIRHGYIKA